LKIIRKLPKRIGKQLRQFVSDAVQMDNEMKESYYFAQTQDLKEGIWKN
jgi:hypothetical protein